MMAYMRTSVSLIGFGFAIVQFFYKFQQIARGQPAPAFRMPRGTWGWR